MRGRGREDLEDAGNCIQCHLEYAEDENRKANVDVLVGLALGRREREGRPDATQACGFDGQLRLDLASARLSLGLVRSQ